MDRISDDEPSDTGQWGLSMSWYVPEFNDTEFGLTAGICTRSLGRATHFRRHAQSGCVMVNLPTAGTDYHVPFGGRKASSFGPREQGRYAAEFYTQVKTAYIRSGEPR